MSETKPSSQSSYPSADREVVSLLREPFSVGEQGIVLAVLGEVAKEKGWSLLSAETGLTRRTLYNSLTADGRPQLDTFLAILAGLGLQLQVVPLKGERRSRAGG